jgi:hypothetical protein
VGLAIFHLHPDGLDDRDCANANVPSGRRLNVNANVNACANQGYSKNAQRNDISLEEVVRVRL